MHILSFNLLVIKNVILQALLVLGLHVLRIGMFPAHDRLLLVNLVAKILLCTIPAMLVFIVFLLELLLSL